LGRQDVEPSREFPQIPFLTRSAREVEYDIGGEVEERGERGGRKEEEGGGEREGGRHGWRGRSGKAIWLSFEASACRSRRGFFFALLLSIERYDFQRVLKRKRKSKREGEKVSREEESERANSLREEREGSSAEREKEASLGRRFGPVGVEKDRSLKGRISLFSLMKIY